MNSKISGIYALCIYGDYFWRNGGGKILIELPFFCEKSWHFLLITDLTTVKYLSRCGVYLFLSNILARFVIKMSIFIYLSWGCSAKIVHIYGHNCCNSLKQVTISIFFFNFKDISSYMRFSTVLKAGPKYDFWSVYKTSKSFYIDLYTEYAKKIW